MIDETDTAQSLGQPHGGGAVMGHSVEGRPIVAEWYGTTGPILYILSAIHGSERSAVTAGERLRVGLQLGLAEREGIQVFFIAAANPDGIARHTRHNANDIDLNRNFPTPNFEIGVGGKVPLSEPESRIIHDTIEALAPAAILSLHCCEPTIDWDGPAGELARVMDEATGFGTVRLGAAPGSLGSWAGGELQIPTITVEFAADEEWDTREQFELVEASIVAAARWTAENGDSPGHSIAERLALEETEHYRSLNLNGSRAELLGPGDEPRVLVLSRATRSDRRALYVAEHVRRVLLSEVYGSDAPVLVVTHGNPDDIEFIESRSLRLAILIEAADDDRGDGVELFGLDEDSVAQTIDPALSLSIGEDSPPGFCPNDVPVVRLLVQTEFAVGDTRAAGVFDDIEVFSRTVIELLKID
ncbi:MAG: DUF2817 domain-containing protein [Bradymonadaceae bacterium]